MAYKSFDSAVDEMLQNRPRFTMGGQEWTCRPSLATKTLMKLSELADAEGAEDDPLSVVKGFFGTVLIRKQRVAFAEMLDSEPDEDGNDDDVVYVGIDQLKSAMEWLVEQYTGKAQEQSKPSSDLPEATGQPLRVVSLDPVSRSQAN